MKQNNTTEHEKGNSTSDFQRHSVASVSKTSLLRNPAVSLHKVAQTSSYRRETLKLQYSQIQQEISLLNIKC